MSAIQLQSQDGQIFYLSKQECEPAQMLNAYWDFPACEESVITVRYPSCAIEQLITFLKLNAQGHIIETIPVPLPDGYFDTLEGQKYQSLMSNDNPFELLSIASYVGYKNLEMLVCAYIANMLIDRSRRERQLCFDRWSEKNVNRA